MPIVKNRRRWDRNSADIHNASTSHVIKAGWKAKSGKYPIKLPGLLLCKEAVGSDGRNVVDLAAMKRLGFTAAQIKEAIDNGEKAAANSLPTEITVRIAHHAKWSGDEESGYWTFPGTFDESYQCWKKDGLFCHGDGHMAQRTQKDGTKSRIDCIPVGVGNADPEDYCPISVAGDCKPKGRLIVRPCIFREATERDIERGTPSWDRIEPLLETGGLARLDTGSDRSLMGIGEVLAEAADRLRGKLAGLSGTLSVRLQRRRTKEGPVNVPAISLAFNEEEMIARERLWLEIDQQRRGIIAIEAPATTKGEPKALPAPEQDEAVDPPAPSDDELSTDDQPIEAEFVEEEEPARSDDEQRDFDRLMELAEKLAEEKESWFMGPREVVEAASEFKKNHRIHQPEDFFRHEGKDADKHAIAMKWMRKTIVRLESGEWSPPEGWESAYAGGDA